jgi:hypothetical protein
VLAFFEAIGQPSYSRRITCALSVQAASRAERVADWVARKMANGE